MWYVNFKTTNGSLLYFHLLIFFLTEKLTPQHVNSLHPYAHMHPITVCYRELSDPSQKPASRRLECTPSTALAAPERAVWCVSGSWRAALILIDPHGWHRRSPPTNQNKQTGEKHRNCQKWHNEDNESTSLTAEQANAVCGHEAQWGVEISSHDLCLKTKCVSWSNPGPDHLKMMLYEHLRFFGRLAVIGL